MSSLGQREGQNAQQTKTPYDYLSPESQQELLRSKEEVKEKLNSFKNPTGAALVALSIASLISDAVTEGLIDKTETLKFMEVVVKVNATSTKMADEASNNFVAQKAINSGLTQEA